MATIARGSVLCAIAVLVWQPSAVRAQRDKKSVPAAPIPSQILTAKTVFISNEGGDVNTNLGSAGTYGAAPTDAYNQFYAAIKSWGRYALVSTPEDADLVFAIRFTVPIAQPGARDNAAWADPQLRVAIMDRKTHVILWAFTEHVEAAALQGNRNKNLSAAVDKLIADVKLLTLAH
ncbi:MAG TPA: hypothetical protein VMF66_21150 [Candidatus Acidoferrum sp.]|nr:hypothetical protein [Candidatus Acidoferrum sp.]